MGTRYLRQIVGVSEQSVIMQGSRELNIRTPDPSSRVYIQMKSLEKPISFIKTKRSADPPPDTGKM